MLIYVSEFTEPTVINSLIQAINECSVLEEMNRNDRILYGQISSEDFDRIIAEHGSMVSTQGGVPFSQCNSISVYGVNFTKNSNFKSGVVWLSTAKIGE